MTNESLAQQSQSRKLKLQKKLKVLSSLINHLDDESIEKIETEVASIEETFKKELFS
jgi:ribosomal protein S25